MKLNNFEDFNKSLQEDSIDPSKGFGLTTQVQDSIKSICESMLHPEAKKYDEDEDAAHTYEGYQKACIKHLKECMSTLRTAPVIPTDEA